MGVFISREIFRGVEANVVRLGNGVTYIYEVNNIDSQIEYLDLLLKFKRDNIDITFKK